MQDFSDNNPLFARPSFFEGVARAFDLGGTLQEYNNSRSGTEADIKALASDARAVSNDMWQAVDTVANELGESLG